MTQLRVLFFVFVLVTVSVISVHAQKTTQAEPTAKEAIRQIFLNGSTLLSSAKHCSSMKTEASDRTILDLLSGFLAFQTEPDMSNSIEFSFKSEGQRSGQILWVCDVIFRSGDIDSPSANGIRFKLRNSDRKAVPGSFSCIGTG